MRQFHALGSNGEAFVLIALLGAVLLLLVFAAPAH